MKKLFKKLSLITLCVFSFQSFAQAENWFVTQLNGTLNQIESSLVAFKQTWPDWAKEVSKYVRYSLEVSFEYDDNIFLRPSGIEEDVIQAVRQEIELEIPGEETLFYARFANTLPYYIEEDELVADYDIETRFSYNPTDKLSLGISNQFFKIEDSEVGTSLGDLVLSLGYLTDILRTEAKYDLSEKTSLKFAWGFDHLDYDEDRVAVFIDRDVHDIDVQLIHQIYPHLECVVGYRFRDVAFDDLDNKDSESNILYTGAKWKWAGLFTLFSEIGYEEREFQNNSDLIGAVPGTARRHHNNVNYRIGVEANLSQYNTFSIYYDDRLYESSRSEYTNYQGKTVGLNLRHFLSEKTLLFFDFYGQRQDFESKDTLVSLFGTSDAKTDVYRYSTTLRRILNSWLHCDIGYIFTKRNTDFVDEDSNNHRFRVGFKAIF